MTDSRDIAVIGAGVVGICCARVLQRQGHRVSVFDPEKPGSGASFGNAGHIALDHIRPLARLDILAQVPRMLADPLGPLSIRWRDAPVLAPWLARFAFAARPAQVARGTAALADLLRGSAAAWAEEMRGSNLAGLFRAKGALVVYNSERGFKAAAGERALLRAHGIAVETMEGDAARALAPGLDASIRAATYFPAAQHVGDPHGLVVGLAESFSRDGGRIERLAVTGFELADGAVRAVTTPAGALPADAVVLAAGLASRDFGPLLGLSLPLVDERGYHVMIAPAGARFEVPVTWGERGFDFALDGNAADPARLSSRHRPRAAPAQPLFRPRPPAYRPDDGGGDGPPHRRSGGGKADDHRHFSFRRRSVHLTGPLKAPPEKRGPPFHRYPGERRDLSLGSSTRGPSSAMRSNGSRLSPG